jgi:hypothetical protein
LLWTIVVEGAIFAIGARIYAKATHPGDRVGAAAFRSFIVVLILFYLLNVFGPPPPSERAIAFAALGMWLLVIWAYWLDRHRLTDPRPRRPSFITLGSLSEPPAN